MQNRLSPGLPQIIWEASLYILSILTLLRGSWSASIVAHSVRMSPKSPKYVSLTVPMVRSAAA
jgi:hypothetical protein